MVTLAEHLVWVQQYNNDHLRSTNADASNLTRCRWEGAVRKVERWLLGDSVEESFVAKDDAVVSLWTSMFQTLIPVGLAKVDFPQLFRNRKIRVFKLLDALWQLIRAGRNSLVSCTRHGFSSSVLVEVSCDLGAVHGHLLQVDGLKATAVQLRMTKITTLNPDTVIIQQIVDS